MRETTIARLRVLLATTSMQLAQTQQRLETMTVSSAEASKLRRRREQLKQEAGDWLSLLRVAEGADK